MKHSKGPWSYDGEDVVAVGDEEYTVALITGSDEENEANGRLIAQAPDMYEVLTEIIAESINGHVRDVTVRKAQQILARIEA